MAKISVILPFFNAEKTLERSVESVLNQTFTDFELFLVNNNSFDQSSDISEKYSKQDKRIKLIFEPKQDVSHAANAGILASTGKYIARTDADDEMLPNRLQLQYELLENEPNIDICATQAEHVGNANSSGIEAYVEMTNRILSPEEISANRFRELPVLNPTLMFRREVFENHGVFQHNDLPEDYEFFLRLMRAGVRFKKIPQKLHRWHDSATRLTRTNSRYSEQAFMKTKALYLSYFLKDTNEKRPIFVWGAGKEARRSAGILENFGIKIQNYIDVDKRKTEKSDVIHYQNLPTPDSCFIISLVGNRGAGDEIKSFLQKNNYTELKDFVLAK